MVTQILEIRQNLIPETDSTVHGAPTVVKFGRNGKHPLKRPKKKPGLEHNKADIYNLTINISDSKNAACYFHSLDAEIKSHGNIIRWKGA